MACINSSSSGSGGRSRIATSRKRNSTNINSKRMTSSVIALVFLSFSSTSSVTSTPLTQQQQEWEDDDGDYGELDEDEDEQETRPPQTSRSNFPSRSPPSFPYLAYAISHPDQDGSIESLRRHGFPIPVWALSSTSPSSSSFSSASNPSPQSPQHILAPRRLIISESDTVLFPGTKTPLSPVLLILVPILISLLFLGYSIICLYTSRGPVFSSSTSRRVLDERARAKTELRLRGAGGYRPPGGLSPEGSSLGHHTTNQRSAGSSRIAGSYDQKNLGLGLSNDGESSSAGSSSSGMVGNGRAAKIPNGPRAMGGGRHAQQPSSASLLALPTLNNTSSRDTQRSAGTGHYAGRAAAPPPTSYAGGEAIQKSMSGGRMSTSVGRGTDLGRNRSLKRETSRPSVEDLRGSRRSQQQERYGDPLSNPHPHPVPRPQQRQIRPAVGPRRPTGDNVATTSNFRQQTQKLNGQNRDEKRNSALSIGDNPLDPGEDSLDETRSRISSQHSTSMTGHPLLPLNGAGFGDGRNGGVPTSMPGAF